MNDYFQTDMLMVYMDQSGMCVYDLDAAYIVSYLKQNGFKANILINYDMFSIDELVDQILSYKSRSIVFILFESNFHAIKRIAEMLKIKSEKESVIIAGGNIATFSPEKALRFAPYIDICYLNEGEDTILELVQCINKGLPYDDVLGICYRSADGSIIVNQLRQLHECLDDFASPYLSGVIDPRVMFEKNRMVTMLLSRGCVFNCKFCNWMPIRRKGVRFHSIDRVINELKYIIEKTKDSKKIVQVRFIDDLFTANRNTVIELCKRIKEERLKLEFRFHTRPDCIDEELIRILHEAGCTRMSFGLESAVPKILHSMGKINSKEDDAYEAEKRYIRKTKKVVEVAKKYHVETIVNIICGWYEEEIDDINQSFQYVKEIGADRYFPAILTYFPGTEAFSEVEPLVADYIQQLEAEGEPVFNLTYSKCPFIYRYNPYELEHMSNDQPAMYKLKDRRIIQQIMGIGFVSEHNRQLFLSARKDMKFDWVARNMLLTTQVSLVSENDDFQIISYPKMVFGYECVKNGEYRNESCTEICLNSKKITVNDVISTKDIDKYSILYLRNASEVERLCDYLSKMSIAEFTALFSTNGKALFIQDFCMWVGECQACSVSRMYLKENGQICSCKNGKAIADMDDDIFMDKIQKTVNQLREEEYTIRGCKHCEIYDICSKCLYVNHIGRQEYCAIQKETTKRRLFNRIYKIKIMDYFFY